MTSPRLLIPEIAENQASKYLTHNEALRVVDALVQTVVQAQQNTPPGSPANGQCWIVGASPTDAWVGKANQIAQWYNSAWYFHVPSAGWKAYNVATASDVKYSGTAWENVNASLGGGTSQSASGTIVTFTGIPDTAKRITVGVIGLSGSGSSAIILRAGTSSGIQTTNYASVDGRVTITAGNTGATYLTSGINIIGAPAAAVVSSGVIQLTKINGNNWAASGNIYYDTGSSSYGSGSIGGHVLLSGVLDRVAVTTVNGTDTFDAGNINVYWE